ncbi:hypothetical protein BS47DRAFT_1324026 [Hydnum rufescens UP504]|uniref:F-box domain-containing protein n=1 Tax=Hydnum rufescens UP504 TaxID=1448309 RepID=A0A9P6E2B2_9AGAM|nr:hypothetical protein BS47DRAFT_1324026 [Hydnum rufescens UP504]
MQLGEIHRRVLPMLQMDIVSCLPMEIGLHVFSYLSVDTLLAASLVDRQWNRLANDQGLWRGLCHANKWEWRTPYQDTLDRRTVQIPSNPQAPAVDEGFGDDEPENDASGSAVVLSMANPPDTKPSVDETSTDSAFSARRLVLRHSSPAVLLSNPKLPCRPDYKALYRTRTILRRRLRTSNYRLTTLHDPIHTPLNGGTDHRGGHTSTIYSLCLASDPRTSEPTLYTASRDQRILQWNLSSPAHSRSSPTKVFQGVHVGSVLSICVSATHGFLISGGSDGQIVIWSLRTALPVKVLEGRDGHYDSVLCVRCDEERVVSCSKDRTLRIYDLLSLKPLHTLRSHRAAVNSLALSNSLIVSASGDRSLRLWDAETGDLLRIFEGHHTRGLASIDFSMPHIVTGSSDRQIRLFDLCTHRGWSTDPWRHQAQPLSFPESHVDMTGLYSAAANAQFSALIAAARVQAGLSGAETGGGIAGDVCELCGGDRRVMPPENRVHLDLVRAVVMDEDVVVSASYDSTIKVWDKKTGALLSDLVSGHTGRIFGVAFDCTKIVSCGEDARICIWDFSFGLDTAFVKL